MQTNEANPPIVIKPDSHCVVTTASSHLHFAFDNQLAKLCNREILEHISLRGALVATNPLTEVTCNDNVVEVWSFVWCKFY